MTAAGVPPLADLFFSTLPEGSLLKKLNLAELDDFKRYIQKKASDTGKPIKYAGAVILQGFILDKFRNKIDVTDQMKKRLEYFNSPEFLTNFITIIPARDSAEVTAHDTSYSEWFDTLFNTKFKGWRQKRLIHSGNETQCERVVGKSDTPPCYLCGSEINITKGHSHKECEHVLPVVSALSHLWLAKEKIDKFTKNQQAILQLEYNWSHKCCNQVKSNYEFICINPSKSEYIINLPLIRYYFSKLDNLFGPSATHEEYDCKHIITNKITYDDARRKLVLQLKVITDIINHTIQKFGDVELYNLLIKFKIISAFSDDDLIKSLQGEGDSIPIYSKEVKQKETHRSSASTMRKTKVTETERLLKLREEGIKTISTIQSSRISTTKYTSIWGLARLIYTNLPVAFQNFISSVSFSTFSGGQRGGGGEEPNGIKVPAEENPDEYFDTHLQPLDLPVVFLTKIGYDETAVGEFRERGFIGPEELNNTLISYILANYSITEEIFEELFSTFQANSSETINRYNKDATEMDEFMNNNVNIINIISQQQMQSLDTRANVLPKTKKRGRNKSGENNFNVSYVPKSPNARRARIEPTTPLPIAEMTGGRRSKNRQQKKRKTRRT